MNTKGPSSLPYVGSLQVHAIQTLKSYSLVQDIQWKQEDFLRLMKDHQLFKQEFFDDGYENLPSSGMVSGNIGFVATKFMVLSRINGNTEMASSCVILA